MSNASVPMTATHQRSEKSAQWMWTGFILVFFGLQAILWTVAITLTANDPSHAVIPSYQNGTWAEAAALERASQKLGWQAEFEFGTGNLMPGRQQVTLVLTDAEGQTIEDATIRMRAYHKARAGRPQEIQWAQQEPGKYVGQVLVRKSGLWNFEGTATVGSDSFLVEQSHYLESDLQLTHPAKRDEGN